MKSTLALLLFAFAVISCRPENKAQGKPTVQATQQKDTITTKSDKHQPILHARLEFLKYDDDGDYFQLMAKKGNELFVFINEQSDDRSLLRGDTIDISWKVDTIEIPGDGGSKMAADKIVSFVKVADGNVSRFRTLYKFPLHYTWAKDEDYSQSYLDKVYLQVEYYLANTNNRLIRDYIRKKTKLSYSIEQQYKDEQEYTIIGISTTAQHHVNIIQWLYLNVAENSSYEYDLAADSLIRFDYPIFH